MAEGEYIIFFGVMSATALILSVIGAVSKKLWVHIFSGVYAAIAILGIALRPMFFP